LAFLSVSVQDGSREKELHLNFKNIPCPKRPGFPGRGNMEEKDEIQVGDPADNESAADSFNAGDRSWDVALNNHRMSLGYGGYKYT